MFTQEGKIPVKKTQFIQDFLAANHCDSLRVAAMFNITRVAVNYWFSNDDIKLSYVFKIVENLGYKFDIFLTQNPQEIYGQITEKTYVDISNFINLPSQCVPKKLSFLTLALTRSNLTKLQLSELINVPYATVRYWFSNDDIMLSRIFQIAETCKFSIRFTIKPLNTDLYPSGTSSNPVVVNNIILQNRCYF